MGLIRISDLLPRRVLVSRATARSIQTQLSQAVQSSTGHVTLDFAGVEGVAPSFLDEVLCIIEEHVPPSSEIPQVTVANPPMGLSPKFRAVARAHKLNVEEEPDGSWTLRAEPRAAA